MRFIRQAPVLFLLLCATTAYAQTENQAAAARAQELLAKVRQALGGADQLNAVRSLSLSGKIIHHRRTGQTTAELKIDLLLPDKFLKTEESRLQHLTFATMLQAINGERTWFDRQVHRATADDGSSEINRGQTAAPSQVANQTAGMRGAATGNTTVRTKAPDGTASSERTVLGMRIPTSGGRENDNSLSQVNKEAKTSAQQPAGATKSPGLDDAAVKAELGRQLRREFACLTLVWLLQSPANFPLQFAYAGETNADHGQVEALELTGPEQFAARLFIEKASAKPALLSYRELINRRAGYVVSANANEVEPAEPNQGDEVAVQFYFADYRAVGKLRLPFQIIKAVNGVPVEEWKIEKYKLNPDLKAKKFEQK
jgi:hypothetical protein